MDRQVQESLNIIEETRKDGQCLNMKSKWTGAKIPGLQVNLPKWITKDRGWTEPKQGEEGEIGKEKIQNLYREWKEGPVGWGGAKRIRIQQVEVEGLPTPPDCTEDRTGEGLESDRGKEAKDSGVPTIREGPPQ